MTRIVCAWCGEFIRTSKKEMPGPVSHSICDSCASRLKSQIKQDTQKVLSVRMENRG